ncbi:HAMP domain-containing histidine kinase [Methanococcoides orientis]|uniref:sensor histidine kinase n=1 Tax=Methanococcoides orientis TaxID=2822137 RepID=UPI001E5C21A3|nr:HAMP domain-containing sensor histidine kinase [Methanococcoides orientis]UGV39869.1 HAMP domain-containing histidine kinase [Methanococcoides orientis]
MIDNMCLLVPEGIIREVKYVAGNNDLFKNVNVIGVPYTDLLEQKCDCVNCGLIQQALESSECFYKALLIHGSECPDIIRSPECKGTLHTHGMENLYELMLSSRELEEYNSEFIISSGWLDKILSQVENDELGMERIRKCIDSSYSSILHLETGFYEGSSKNLEKFSEVVGKPFRTMHVDVDFMGLSLENIVLEHDCVSKTRKLKEATEKMASCSMSIEIIKELVELKDEKEVAEKISQMYNVLFSPEKVSYISVDDGLVQSEFSISSDPDNELNRDFLESDEKYLLSESRDGFLLKIKNQAEVMGTVEVKGFSYPGNINEYLNTALIIANASSLVVSNIRRYQEILESRKRQQDLADTLKVVNKILRHDVANNLNVEINAIELYNLKNDAKFLEMAQSSAHRSVETIRNMKDIESQFLLDSQDLLPYHVHDLIKVACRHFDIKSSIEGNALIMADNALPSVIENIIRNAQVHGKADSIHVTIDDDQTNCKIRIMDNGVGIPDEIKAYIFGEGFKYGDTGNTGLGLYIVKKTIERYNGTIYVSDNIPKGASFIIELPSIHTVDSSTI